MQPPIQPSIRETAFSCPYCSAFTAQFWYDVFGDPITGEKAYPAFPDEEFKQLVQQGRGLSDEQRRSQLEWIEKIESGLVFLGNNRRSRQAYSINNLYVSRCFTCKEIAVWVHDRLIFPATKSGVPPNPDLPKDLLRDFEEAREIVNSSPRGAAALLRLCVQKLCRHLGEKGDNINEDIRALVKKGLNPLVQKSLDIVRVIGNEGVHPLILRMIWILRSVFSNLLIRSLTK
jgi:hypothetical protein